MASPVSSDSKKRKTPPSRVKPKGTTRKRPRSLNLDTTDGDELSGSDAKPILTRTRRTTKKRNLEECFTTKEEDDLVCRFLDLHFKSEGRYQASWNAIFKLFLEWSKMDQKDFSIAKFTTIR
jgi:hypothetical protein